MIDTKKEPGGPLAGPVSGNDSTEPFVDNENIAASDMVDQASHGGGKRNAEKRSSRSLEQTRGSQGRPGQIDDGKRHHRK